MTDLPFPYRVGVSGTGFIARGFIAATRARSDYRVSAVLTRRPPISVDGIPHELLVRSAEELAERCDLVVECSGDVLHATEVIDAALHAGLPVVTMNSEFHVTTGSWFTGRGMLTEAEGDQSGSLAALAEEVESMGSAPEMAFKRRAASSALFAKGPIWSREEAKATSPNRETRPYDGFTPTVPVSAAG